jgi:hypothetical protein
MATISLDLPEVEHLSTAEDGAQLKGNPFPSLTEDTMKSLKKLFPWWFPTSSDQL